MANNFKNDPVIGDGQIDDNGKPVDTVKEAAANPPTGPTDPFAGSTALATEPYQPERRSAFDLQKESIQQTLTGEEVSANSLQVTDTQFDRLTEIGMLPVNGRELENLLADEEGWGVATSKAVAGFALKTGVNVVGGLAGGVWGIGKFLYEGVTTEGDFDFTNFYKNEVTAVLDNMTDTINESLGVHKSEEFQNSGFFGKFKNPTMFLDEFGDSLAFMAGAIITEYATLGLGSAAVAARGAQVFGKYKWASKVLGAAHKKTVLDKAKYIDEVIEGSIEAQKLTGAAARSKRLKDKLTFARQTLVTGSAYEASFETRKAVEELELDLTNRGFSKEEIEEISSKAEKWIFGGNLLITNLSNSAQFSALFKSPLTFLGGKKTAQGARRFMQKKGVKLNKEFDKVDDFILKADKGFKTRFTKGKMSTAMALKAALANPFYEGMEEASQGILAETVTDHYGSKATLKADANISMLDAFMDSTKKQFTTKEGWNEVLMGAMVGSMGRVGKDPKSSPDQKRGFFEGLKATDNPFTNFMESKRNQRKAEEVVASLNQHVKDYTNDKLKSMVRSSLDEESYIKELQKNGSKVDAMYDNYVFDYFEPFVKYGYTDIARANIESFRTMSGEEFADALLEPEEAARMKTGSPEKLNTWKTEIVDNLMGKIDALEESYELMDTFDNLDQEVKHQLAKYHYKTKTIPDSNRVLVERISNKIGDAAYESIKKNKGKDVADKSEQIITQLKEKMTELISGAKFVEKEGELVRKSNQELAAELRPVLADLLTNGVIDMDTVSAVNGILSNDTQSFEGVSNEQAAVGSLLSAIDPTLTKDAVNEINILNHNSAEYDIYRQLYNSYLANPTEYRKKQTEKLKGWIDDATTQLEEYIGDITEQVYIAQVELIKKNLDQLDQKEDSEYIESIRARLKPLEEERQKIRDKEAALAKKVKKIADSEADENPTDNDDNIYNPEPSESLVDASETMKVDASASLSLGKEDNGEAFESFIKGLAAKNVIMSQKNTTSHLSLFSGDVTDPKPVKFKKEWADDIEAFKADLLGPNATVHIGVTIEVKNPAISKKEGTFFTYLNSNPGEVDDTALNRIAHTLWVQAVKENNKKGKTNLNNVKVEYPKFALTRGMFKREYDADGKRIFADVPIAKTIKKKHSKDRKHIKDIVEKLSYTDRKGRVMVPYYDKKQRLKFRVDPKAGVRALNKNGKVQAGNLLLNGKDKFGRDAVFKLNTRRLQDASTELDVVTDILTELMTNPNLGEKDDAGNDSSQEVLNRITEKLKTIPGVPFEGDSLRQILGQIVYYGENTDGRGNEFIVYTKKKAFRLKGQMYQYNKKKSAKQGKPVFDVMTGPGAGLQTVGIPFIREQLGTLRQNVSFKDLAENGGDNGYAEYMLGNVVESDINLDVEFNKEGDIDFAPVLEHPKFYIRKQAFEKEADTGFDLEEAGLQTLFSTVDNKFGKGYFKTPFKKFVADNKSEILELTMEEVLNSGNERYTVKFRNNGDKKVKMGNVTLPDGVEVHIKNFSKGVIEFEFHLAHGFKGKVTQKGQDALNSLADTENSGSIDLSKIKNVSFVRIIDTKRKNKTSSPNRIEIGDTTFHSMVKDKRREVKSRIKKQFQRVEKKKGNKNDTDLTAVMKAIFFPKIVAKKNGHTKITDKQVKKMMKENPKDVAVIAKVMQEIASFGYDHFLNGKQSKAKILIDTFNKYKNDSIDKIKIKNTWAEGSQAAAMKKITPNMEYIDFGFTGKNATKKNAAMMNIVNSYLVGRIASSVKFFEKNLGLGPASKKTSRIKLNVESQNSKKANSNKNKKVVNKEKLKKRKKGSSAEEDYEADEEDFDVDNLKDVPLFGPGSADSKKKKNKGKKKKKSKKITTDDTHKKKNSKKNEDDVEDDVEDDDYDVLQDETLSPVERATKWYYEELSLSDENMSPKEFKKLTKQALEHSESGELSVSFNFNTIAHKAIGTGIMLKFRDGSIIQLMDTGILKSFENIKSKNGESYSSSSIWSNTCKL